MSQSRLCQKHPVKQHLAMLVVVVSVYDSFLPAVRQQGKVEKRARSVVNKGRIVQGYKTVPCGCQENKVAVKPIRDVSFSSWYWLLSGAGMVDTWASLQGDCWKSGGALCAEWRHSNLVEKLNDWKWSGCFHMNRAGWWARVHYYYIALKWVQSHKEVTHELSWEILVVSGEELCFYNIHMNVYWTRFTERRTILFQI